MDFTQGAMLTNRFVLLCISAYRDHTLSFRLSVFLLTYFITAPFTFYQGDFRIKNVMVSLRYLETCFSAVAVSPDSVTSPGVFYSVSEMVVPLISSHITYVTL